MWHFLILTIEISTTVVSAIQNIAIDFKAVIGAIVDLHQPYPTDIFNALTSERDAFTEARADDDDRSRIDRSRIEKQNAHHSFSSVKASRSVGRSNESHGGL